MRIDIVGAGPAGLYFALLAKKRQPRHDITVWEQDGCDSTYGWGVVFSDRALSFLRDSDSDVYADLQCRLEIWDAQTIVHHDEPVAIDGSRFSAIARLELLRVLREHCVGHGVDIRYRTRVEDIGTFAGSDLVIGADGVRSRVREHCRGEIGPRRRLCDNRYIWYGTTRVFDTLSLIFRANADGHFVAHAYRYSPTMSTFIVECDARTWRRAGLESATEAQSRAYCEQVFAPDLQGRRLMSNNSAWLRFPVLTTRRWHHGNVVLIGDALRTVHFSIGSGTRTAMEDAIALEHALHEHGEDLTATLGAFESQRRPAAERLLAVAAKSLAWYEDFGRHMHLDPLPFAMHYVLRGERVDLDRLRRRAPVFVARYERWHAGH